MRTRLDGGGERRATRPAEAPGARGEGNAAVAYLGRTGPPLVLACDAGYAMPLATTLRSLVEANRAGWPLDVHVLAEAFSEEAKRRVARSLPPRSATIRWIPVDLGLFGQFSTPDHISRMTYARVVIPQAFPESVRRVVYLDADLLVLGDLRALWEADLGGAVVGAVLDEIDAQIKADKPGLEAMPRVRSYFNAGVLVIDLERWREERITERAIAYLAGHPRTPICDQDALNVACDGLWRPLDPRWNFQDHYETRLAALGPDRRPAIVHFVTSLKPWKPSSFSVNATFYDAFRSRTAYARTRAERVSDALRGEWCRTKRFLKRYALVRAIRERVRGLGARRPSSTAQADNPARDCEENAGAHPPLPLPLPRFRGGEGDSGHDCR